MRYTCNKKAFPDLKKDCLKCSEYNPCAEGGKWCFVAVAQMVEKAESQKFIADQCVSKGQPICTSRVQLHDYRDIKIAENTTVTIDLEELKIKLNESYFPSMLAGGK